MASTAAGVAVGSTVGHMLGAGISGMVGFFLSACPYIFPSGLDLHEVVLTNGAIQFGGSSPAEAPAAAAEPVQAQSASNSSWGAPSCEADARSFTKCLDENQGNMQICSWYLDQLVCSSHLPGSGDWVANA